MTSTEYTALRACVENVDRMVKDGMQQINSNLAGISEDDKGAYTRKRASIEVTNVILKKIRKLKKNGLVKCSGICSCYIAEIEKLLEPPNYKWIEFMTPERMMTEIMKIFSDCSYMNGLYRSILEAENRKRLSEEKASE